MIGAREMRRRQEADEHGRNFVRTSDCSEYPKAEQRWKASLSIIRSQKRFEW